MNTKNKMYENFSIKKIDKSRIELVASLSADIFDSYRPAALKNLNESVTIDGFRKGKVPENILVQKVGDKTVLEEMAELAISKVYPEILINEKIDAIGRPEVRITKLARGNPLEFTIITAVVPTFELPDCKAIANAEIKKLPEGEEKITDKELDDAILRVRKSRTSHESHDHEKMTAEEHEKTIMANLPELTDDFVKSVGDFTDIPDFKNKLSTMLVEDKKNIAKEKRRIAIADAIGEKTKIELPDIMIESELNRNEAQFKADIERMGLKIEDYLKHAKKTIEDLRVEWRPHAEKKAKLQLILNSISEKENVHPSKEEIDNEVDHIIEHYKDANRERAEAYAETVLTNERVFQWLEK
jgi:FKBP-type peptidyl-prolyl cis-trans isomerase (trigger factor)